MVKMAQWTCTYLGGGLWGRPASPSLGVLAQESGMWVLLPGGGCGRREASQGATGNSGGGGNVAKCFVL